MKNYHKEDNFRIIKNLDKLSQIDCEITELAHYSSIGRRMKMLSVEMEVLMDRLRALELPIGTTVSSHDGEFTLGCFNGPRVLDRERYHRSGVSDVIAREHPEILVPESADALSDAAGEDMSGYYTARPVVRVTDNSSYRAMMDILSSLRE